MCAKKQKQEIKIVKRWKKCKGREQERLRKGPKSCSCPAYIVSLSLYVSIFMSASNSVKLFLTIAGFLCYYNSIKNRKYSIENIEINKEIGDDIPKTITWRGEQSLGL